MFENLFRMALARLLTGVFQFSEKKTKKKQSIEKDDLNVETI